MRTPLALTIVAFAPALLVAQAGSKAPARQPAPTHAVHAAAPADSAHRKPAARALRHKRRTSGSNASAASHGTATHGTTSHATAVHPATKADSAHAAATRPAPRAKNP
jgi:hypothetical protein